MYFLKCLVTTVRLKYVEIQIETVNCHVNLSLYTSVVSSFLKKIRPNNITREIQCKCQVFNLLEVVIHERQYATHLLCTW